MTWAFFLFQVTYSIIQGENSNDFKIDPTTGVITSLIEFDRETKASYVFQVLAKDGAPSDIPALGGEPNSGNKLKTLVKPVGFFSLI